MSYKGQATLDYGCFPDKQLCLCAGIEDGPRLDVVVAALGEQRHDERLEWLATVQRALRAHLQPAGRPVHGQHRDTKHPNLAGAQRMSHAQPRSTPSFYLWIKMYAQEFCGSLSWTQLLCRQPSRGKLQPTCSYFAQASHLISFKGEMVRCTKRGAGEQPGQTPARHHSPYP